MKTGLYFGSFSPIHLGHLAIANYMVEFTDIEELWFVVSPLNPFKEKQQLADAARRLEMVRLAVEGDPRLCASDIEFGLSVPSFTINTLIRMGKEYPDREPYLVMGSDNLLSLPAWKDAQLILQKYPILVYPRHGYDIDVNTWPGQIKVTEAPRMEISSTFIRESIASGKDVRHFIHDKVWQYINDNNLYRLL